MKLIWLYVNSDDDYTEPTSVYSEGNWNNDVVTEAIVNRDAMPASAAVGAQSDGNAAKAESPVIGAAAVTPKASSVTTMSSDKVAKSTNGNPMKKKSSPDKLRERLSNMRHGLTQKDKEGTERLSPKSSGKKGTTSSANNNGQRKSTQIEVQNNGNVNDKDTHADLLNQEESSHSQKGKK